MNSPLPIEPALPPAPGVALQARLTGLIEALVVAGQRDHAEELRAALDAWQEDQKRWEARLGQLLGVHHEINNALVGVRGHAQLLLHGSAGSEPKVRDRLEVIIRESGRIEKAAQQIREVRNRLPGSDPPTSHAA